MRRTKKASVPIEGKQWIPMVVNTLELKLDWALWPRYSANTQLDSVNIRNLKQAILVGEPLPPVWIDSKSYRVIDGFHRVTAYNKIHPDGIEIAAFGGKFKNDAEMFLEAARLNSRHGLGLSPRDRVHVILMAKRYNVPLMDIADTLGFTVEEVERLEATRTAISPAGEAVALPGGACGLSGKKLTVKQHQFAKSANGMVPIVNARLLLNALNANALTLTTQEIDVLTKLRDAIDKALGRRRKGVIAR